MRRLPLTILAILLLASGAGALKILMYQLAFSNTHMPFSGAIADALIDRGHVVDKIIMEYHTNVKNNGSTRLRNVYRIRIEDNPFMTSTHLTDPFQYMKFDRNDPKGAATRLAFCKALIEDEELIAKLKAERYDVFMVAPFDFTAFGLNQILKIPTVNAYAAMAQDGFASIKLGVPALPSYVPQIFDGRVQGRAKGFLDRLWSFLYLADIHWDEMAAGRVEIEYFRKRIPNLPSIAKMFSSISYVFLNSNEIIDIPQPTTHKIKYIGGIAMKPPAKGELTEELEHILSSAPRGTVLFSFGSLIKTATIPTKAKLEFLKAFRSFHDYNFIWKLDADDEVRHHLANYTNVYAATWLPQIPLLNDNRVKLFMTHAGMNSYLEASHAGKPLVAIPVFVDQYYNTNCMLNNRVGVSIDKQNISAQSVSEALHQVLSDDSYARNAREIARMLRDRPVDPREELVRYVEFSARHPRLSQVLQLEGAEMPLWKQYSLDVIGFLIMCALVGIAAIVFTLRFTVKIFTPNAKRTPKKTKRA